MRRFASLTAVVLAAGILVLHACQDESEVTSPSALSIVSYRLTITGSGTGSGTVTSSPSGIRCTITAGTAATTGCSFSFAQGTAITLTASYATGSSFVGWGSPCSGTGLCKFKMGTNRTISAQFLRGPFTVKISSGSTGGSGRVKSQTGLSPVIDCVITNGTPAATGCSRSYPANTTLTLTSTPAAGYTFAGWRDPACGTGACQFSVIKPATVPVTFSPIVASTPAREGRWEPVFSTPAVAVHLHLTPSGKVFFWGDTGDAEVWNPANIAAGFVPVAKPYRLYCSGHTILPDGRVLVVGGTSPGTRGLRFASVFDPVARTWSRTTSMAQGRYYPTTTVLPNGNVLAISGHDTTLNVVTIPEVWNGSGWRRLTTAPLAIPNPYYPAMFVAPNGKVFLAGFPQTTRYLDVTSTGRWTTVGNRVVADRTLGSAVMYAPGKILYAGGGDPPTATAEVIDLEHGAIWRSVSSMAFARRQMNATILADGTVLVTGGTSGPGFNNQAGAVHTAELWNPATETWKTMAREARHRTYHSTAILLPSGRVLSSGSGEGGGITYANSELSAQVFSPPYLFNADGTLAARPTITSVPARISYGQTFTVQTPNAAGVSRGTLIRLSSVTHAFNQSQMIYPLTFTATSSTSLSATAPPSSSFATPGTYMLFLINNAGVPSTALMTVVGP
jgi:hypothetical protein